MRLCSPSPPATAPCVHGIGTGSGFGTATATGTGHGPFIRALLSTMSADTQRLNEKRACCHRRNVDFALGLPRLLYKYTCIYIPVHECTDVCVCVFGTRTFLNILVALNTIRCLFSASTPFLAAAPPVQVKSERRKIISRVQYTLWNCQMDGWMDGIHKKECVGVLILTCCATVTACLPFPSAFLSAPKKKRERRERGEGKRTPTWHRCKEDDCTGLCCVRA